MRRTIKAALLLGCALVLASCGKVIKEPVIQYVTVEKYRPLPDSLLVVPKITYIKERSVEETVRAYNFNTPQLEQCISNMKDLIKLQPQK